MRVVHIRPRGADGLGDHAFAIDLASRGGSDGLPVDDDGRLLRRLTWARAPRRLGGAEQ
jgi:hypothetical protein